MFSQKPKEYIVLNEKGGKYLKDRYISDHSTGASVDRKGRVIRKASALNIVSKGRTVKK